MGKHDVVKPGHFKLKGRDRAGQAGGLAVLGKERFAEGKAREAWAGARPVPGSKTSKRTRVRGQE
jgi:hypothetical protein